VVANNQIEEINQLYSNDVNYYLSCICDKAKHLENFNKQTKNILVLNIYKTALQSNCLSKEEINIILNKIKSLFKCKIDKKVEKPIDVSSLIYVGTYTFGASLENPNFTGSLPLEPEDFDLLVTQIEGLTNTLIQPAGTYYIETKQKNQVFNTFFSLTSTLLGSHFIAVPQNINLQFIFDVTQTDVINSFVKEIKIINGINYDIYILNAIVQPNIITYYYLI